MPIPTSSFAARACSGVATTTALGLMPAWAIAQSQSLGQRISAAIQPYLYSLRSVVWAVSLAGATCSRPTRASSRSRGVTGGANSVLAGQGWLFGLIMAALVGLVIIGGIRSIAKVTEKVVPIMAVLYLGAGLIVLLMNADKIFWAFGENFGAAFSNEVGIGSAAIAHSAVQTDQPVSQGFAALLEPFIDTVVICTMIAPVINFSDSMIFAMSLANIVGLYFLMPVVKRELDKYWQGIQTGTIKTFR